MTELQKVSQYATPSKETPKGLGAEVFVTSYHKSLSVSGYLGGLKRLTWSCRTDLLYISMAQAVLPARRGRRAQW